MVETETERTEAPRGHGEHILYVDDEPGLARVGKRRLEALGYRVSLANSGEEALQAIVEDPTAFHAVVSDYLMPGMNGLVLAGALYESRPELPVIILTGYIDNIGEEQVRETGVVGLLRKPATTVELAETLADVLQGDARG